MAIVIARTRKSDGGKVYWDGGKVWWPDIDRGLRYSTEAEAKEAVASYKLHRETRGLKPHDTTGYEYVDVGVEVVLAGGPSGNVHVTNYVDEKDTTPNGFRNDE